MADHILIQVRDDIVTRLKAGVPAVANRVYVSGEIKLEELDPDALPLIFVQVGEDAAEDAGVNGGDGGVPNVLEDIQAGYTIYCVVQQTGDAEKAAYDVRTAVESTLFGTIAARTLGGKAVSVRRPAANNNRDDAVEQGAYTVALQLAVWVRHLDKNPDSFTY